jgi:transcriptional regulator with XRE-family HTH domain
METSAVALAQRITHERLRRGWSRTGLARRAGLDPSYVTRVEQAKFREPSVEKIRALASALGLPVDALTDPPPAEMPDEDVLLRRLIEKRLGSRPNAELVQWAIDQARGRPPADQATILKLVGVLLETMPLPDSS